MTRKVDLIYIDEHTPAINRFKRFASDYFNLTCLIPNQDFQKFVAEIVDKNPDILVVDFNLKEYKSDICYDGVELVEAIHQIKFALPCLILTSHTGSAMEQSLDPNTIHFKGELIDTDAKELLIMTIKRNVEIFENKINVSIQRHDELLGKISSGNTLSNPEKSELTELDEYLEKTTNNMTTIPSSLKDNLISGQLNTLIEDTRELLEQAKRNT